MKKENVKMGLSETVSPLIGHEIDFHNIYSDEKGWGQFIPINSLNKGYPLILANYLEGLFIVIPSEDWKSLETEMVSIEDYVSNAKWSYGYYWGGTSMLKGVRWQPIEEKGIQDTEKISRYLTLLKCRTIYRANRNVPSKISCMSCSIEHCPFSNCEEKLEGASWENEIQEVDDRKLLYQAVSERIKKFGLQAVHCSQQTRDTVMMFPGYKKDTVVVHLPRKICIDMMCNPGKKNIQEISRNLDLEIGIVNPEKDKNIIHVSVPEDANTQFFYDNWRDDAICKRSWFKEKRQHEDEIVKDNIADINHRASFMDVIKKAIQSLF